MLAEAHCNGIHGCTMKKTSLQLQQSPSQSQSHRSHTLRHHHLTDLQTRVRVIANSKIQLQVLGWGRIHKLHPSARCDWTVDFGFHHGENVLDVTVAVALDGVRQTSAQPQCTVA